MLYMTQLDSKQELRALYKKKRLRQNKQGSMDACNHLISFLANGQGQTVSLYVSMNGEVEVEYCVHTLQKNNWNVCLPRVKEKNKPLIFNTWDGAQPDEKDILNIPCASGCEVIPDVIVLPLVAFDDSGNRLGMGAGYYDRTLALHTDIQAIGIAYDCQKAAKIPCEPHDKPLDIIITETNILEIQTT